MYYSVDRERGVRLSAKSTRVGRTILRNITVYRLSSTRRSWIIRAENAPSAGNRRNPGSGSPLTTSMWKGFEAPFVAYFVSCVTKDYSVPVVLRLWFGYTSMYPTHLRRRRLGMWSLRTGRLVNGDNLAKELGKRGKKWTV